MDKIRKLQTQNKTAGMGISGQGMDRKVQKKTPIGKRVGYAAAALLVVAFGWWFVETLLQGRSLTVNSQRITVSPVTVGAYEDFIPLRGRLVPRSTVYLDAIEGGRVEEILVEDGAIVEAGDPIAVLSNTNLQLEVLGREAAVTEQLNNMRTIELQLEHGHYSAWLFLHTAPIYDLVRDDPRYIAAHEQYGREIEKQRELAGF